MSWPSFSAVEVDLSQRSVPGLTFVIRKVLPGHPDDLGEHTSVGPNLGGEMLKRPSNALGGRGMYLEPFLPPGLGFLLSPLQVGSIVCKDADL